MQQNASNRVDVIPPDDDEDPKESMDRGPISSTKKQPFPSRNSASQWAIEVNRARDR